MFMEAILLRINHLGINPASGGSPPRERIVSAMRIIRCGEVVQIVPISLTVIVSVWLIERKIGAVVIM